MRLTAVEEQRVDDLVEALFNDAHHPTVTGVTVGPERVTGLDGKSRPATQPKAPEQVGSRSRSATGNLPYEPETERQHLRAKGQYDRIAHGLAEVNGICRGLKTIDYGMAVSVATNEQIAVLAARAAELARSLRDVKTGLEEARDRQAA